MRLFFLLFLLAPLYGELPYLPLAPSKIIKAEAVLLEDISSQTSRAKFKLTQVYSINATTRASYQDLVWLPTVQNSHYSGEIVHLYYNQAKAGSLRVERVVFTKKYRGFLSRKRGQLIGILREKVSTLGRVGPMSEALILGKTDALTIMPLFRDAGVSHLLALSGLHRGIMAAFLILMLKPIIPRLYLGLVILLLLCPFTWLIGVKHSLIRAIFMYGLWVLCDRMGIGASMGKVLLVSGFFQYCLWPDSVMSLSFQLSYLAMGGILLLTSPTLLILKRIFPSLIAIPLSLSISAQIAILPLLLVYFGKFQPWGILAGLILTPLITILLWALILLIPLLFLGDWVGSIGEITLYPIISLIEKVARFFSHFSPIEAQDLLGRLLFLMSISVMILLTSLFFFKEITIGRKNSQIKLRFSLRNTGTFRNDGTRTTKALGTELSHKSRCSTKNC